MTRQKLFSYISARELNHVLHMDEDKQTILLLDVRSPAEFSDAHIAGAFNLPLAEISNQVREIGKNTEIVLICRSGKRSRTAAEKLQAYGFMPKVLEEGLIGWIQSGLPVQRGRGGMSVERQTQLTIGVGVLSGLILGLTVSRWYLLIPAILGVGLTYAGSSGNCGLTSVLAKAPWNQGKKKTITLKGVTTVPSCSN